MSVSRKSLMLVFLQLLLLAALALSGPWWPPGVMPRVWVAGGIALGVWSLATLGLRHLRATPEPAAGAHAEGNKLQVIFITVDPARDTPQVIKAYTAAFDPSFVGLYGDAKRTRETADEFKVYYKQVPTGSSYTMDHSALSYVFDPQGRLRLAMRHEQTAADYAHDIRQVLAGR